MDMTKVLICVALSLVLLVDVAYSAPTAFQEESNQLLTMVKHIDDKLTMHSRRDRRHLRTQQIAIMEFCLKFRQRCRQDLATLRENMNGDITVVVVEK